MHTTTAKSAFRAGVLAGLPFIVVVVPFAMLFGVIATEAGLKLTETVGFSLLVIAGASQFTAVQLMSEAVPVWTVIATALAVNLRMAMYSASLQPHLGAAPLWQRACIAYLNVDSSYALGIRRFEDAPEMPVAGKVVFFAGTILPSVPLWTLGTWAGAILGDRVPESLGLDFAMPILFLAIVGPMLRTLAHLAAAVVSILGAMALSFLPSGIGLLIAGAAAMAVGAEIERRRGR